MSAIKEVKAGFSASKELPEDMATEMFDVKKLGGLIAKEAKLPPGMYDLVIEYKMGGSQLTDGGAPVPAMGVCFSGLALRRTTKENVSTIVVEAKRSRK